MKFEELSLIELASMLQEQKVSSVEVTKYFINRCKEKENLHAVLEVFDDAIAQAEAMDEKIKNGFKGKLAGVPVIIKDNILFKGKKASCSSKFLENYVAQYNSTVVEKMLNEGAVIIARANMDEFAMGSSTENSAFGPTLNALDPTRVPGGSSGGSACAVSAGLCPVSLGTDTGGSIRQPASYNGVVGIKPTYGRVSRYGVVAFASSLEQVGPFTKNVKDNAYMLNVLSGGTIHDETSLKIDVPDFLSQIKGDIKGLKVAVLKEVEEAVKGLDVEETYHNVLAFLKENGAQLIEASIPDFSLTLPCYYIVAPAEATSNLGRFDGVKYSRRSASATNVDDIYLKSRSEGFGKEVKRRIMLGNFVLSSGYFDAYYNKAKKLQQKLKMEASEVFKNCDVILLPTTTGEAFKIGEKVNDPISMYKEDLFTILANVLGTPAISIPCGKGKAGLPFGIQIIANCLNEGTVYNVADYIEKGYRG